MLKLNDELYCFRLILNESKKTVMLLPAGAAVYDKNTGTLKRKTSENYGFNQYGQVYIRNYYDIVKKYGNRPCVVVDEYYNLVFDHLFADQRDVQEQLNIKTSELNSRAHNETDITAAKQEFRFYPTKLSEFEIEKFKQILTKAKKEHICLKEAV